jgi:hypothetical protein
MFEVNGSQQETTGYSWVTIPNIAHKPILPSPVSTAEEKKPGTGRKVDVLGPTREKQRISRRSLFSL